MANLSNMTVPGSIFVQPWWLDAVAPGAWGAAEINNGQDLIARMPYRRQTKFGLNLLTMPPLTQHLGPWIQPADNDAKYSTRLSREHELYQSLLEQLPPYAFFRQRFPVTVANWLPFYWQGFNATTRYTYIIQDITDAEKVWANFAESARRQVRKAQKQLEVQNANLDEFYRLNNLTFERQRMQNPYTLQQMQRMHAACQANHAGLIFKAVDANKNIHAVLYLVWDKHTAYYLMGGGDPELRKSGAASLLIWEAIRYASGLVKQFDFEGSMVSGIERFFRSFGAEQTPYFHITSIKHPAIKLVNRFYPVFT